MIENANTLEEIIVRIAWEIIVTEKMVEKRLKALK